MLASTWPHAAPRACFRSTTGPPSDPHDGPGEPLLESVWVEPYPDEHIAYEQRESVELAFVAALQHLPANQRAVLILPAQSQQATVRALGDRRLGELVDAYVDAWERGDVEAVAAMLADDA
jgi:RNA polymerase sigma-70 factor, ECF subfamily